MPNSSLGKMVVHLCRPQSGKRQKIIQKQRNGAFLSSSVIQETSAETEHDMAEAEQTLDVVAS